MSATRLPIRFQSVGQRDLNGDGTDLHWIGFANAACDNNGHFTVSRDVLQIDRLICASQKNCCIRIKTDSCLDRKSVV